eukprot:1515088-Prorocentrum_lima.AAC.1
MGQDASTKFSKLSVCRDVLINHFVNLPSMSSQGRFNDRFVFVGGRMGDTRCPGRNRGRRRGSSCGSSYNGDRPCRANGFS